MESKTSASKCDLPYHIYGDGEENIYETIKMRKQPLPEMYDEVLQTKPSCKVFEPQQMCDPNCEDRLPSTYGEFRERKFTNIIKKWYKAIPLWVKIAIPMFIICVTIVFNGMLATKLKLLTKVNECTTQSTSSSLSSLPVTTTAKTDAETSNRVASTAQEEVTTAKTAWNYTNKSWYIKSNSPDTYYCDTWELISTVKFQQLDFQGSECYTVQNCLTLIDVYKFNSDGKGNYTFYIDMYGNVYEGRDWYCPYVSGELWIALITTSFNMFRPQSQLQLRHFYEMVSYRRAFEYFNEDVIEEIVNKCSLSSHMSSSFVHG